jgi:hypothetical protein
MYFRLNIEIIWPNKIIKMTNGRIDKLIVRIIVYVNKIVIGLVVIIITKWKSNK